MASRKGSLLAGTAIACALLAGPVAAQEDATSGLVLEEIIVTAQKRAEPLQNAPVAISAISAGAIEDAGIVNIQGIVNMVPSLSAIQNSKNVNQSYRVRGIGSDPNIPTFEPDVALFIDGVYMPRSGLSVDDLVDVERVEVLKGPQVTLYGKNATAGVVNIISATPSDEFQAMGEATLSNIEGGKDALAYRLATSVTGPVAEGVRVRLTGVYYDQDPTFRNLTPGAPDANDMKRYAVRGQFAFDLSETVQLNITGARSETFDTNATDADIYYGSAGEGGAYDVDHHPLLTKALGVSGCTDNDPTNRTICTTAPNQARSHADSASATLTADMDIGTFTAITAWSKYWSGGEFADVDQVSLPLVSFDDVQEGRSFSQELRLVSAGGENLDWLVGAYFLDNRFERGDRGRTPMFTLQRGAGLFPLPGAPTTLITLGQPGDQGFMDSRSASKYYAGFAQATYEVTPELDVTAGLRWQTEKKTASLNNSVKVTPNLAIVALPAGHPLKPYANVNILTASLVPPGVNGALPTLKSDGFTWTLTASYKPEDGGLYYATWSRGTKSGGHNIGFGAATAAQRPFGEETVNNYELGTKQDLWDGRGRLTLSAFHTIYDEYQNAGFVGLQFLVNNADKVRVNGVEADLAAALTETLTLNMGATYLDTEYVRYTGGACYFGRRPDANPVNGAFTSCDLSGQELPLTPDFRFVAGLQYEEDVSFGTLYGRGDLNWQTETVTNSANLDPRSVQDGYVTLNARIGVRLEDGIDLSLWGNNLTNKTVIAQSAVLNLFNQRSEYQTFLNNPREIGVTLRKRF